jgi:hypothetical protein
MTRSWRLWRERWRLWVPALVFFLLNLGVFTVYRVRYAGDVQILDERLARVEGQLAALDTERRELEAARERAFATRAAIDELYRDRFATEKERLTKMIAEVKALAGRAGLVPSAISYPVEGLADYGLVKKSVVFGVEGTYAELRQLINLLELSSSFLTLEGVSLGAAGPQGSLRINLTISTYFSRNGDGAAATAAAAPAAPPPPAAPAARLPEDSGP